MGICDRHPQEQRRSGGLLRFRIPSCGQRKMNQPIFTDASELTAALRTRSTSPIGIISVDGVDGVGKSTLAQRLAAELDLPYVEVDEFVQPEQGGYVDYVGYDLLKVVVEPYGLGMVIEGICIKHVLSR